MDKIGWDGGLIVGGVYSEENGGSFRGFGELFSNDIWKILVSISALHFPNQKPKKIRTEFELTNK